MADGRWSMAYVRAHDSAPYVRLAAAEGGRRLTTPCDIQSGPGEGDGTYS